MHEHRECESCGRTALAGEWLVELLNGPDEPWWVCVECCELDRAGGCDDVD